MFMPRVHTDAKWGGQWVGKNGAICYRPVRRIQCINHHMNVSVALSFFLTTRQATSAFLLTIYLSFVQLYNFSLSFTYNNYMRFNASVLASRLNVFVYQCDFFSHVYTILILNNILSGAPPDFCSGQHCNSFKTEEKLGGGCNLLMFSSMI